jgi:predicted ATPase
MSRLDQIKVRGFKSIREMDLELRPLNILVGANGAGKSNFVSLFKLVNQIVEENLQVFVAKSGGADALLHYGRKTTHEIVVELQFGRNGYACKLIPSAGDTLIFSEESGWFHGQGYESPLTVILGRGHKESKLREQTIGAGRSIERYVRGGLQSWRIYHFHDTSDSAQVKQIGNIDDNASLRADASNLAAFLYLLQRRYQGQYSLIVETIRMVAPFFDDFALRPSPLNPQKVQLEWREKSSDAYFNAYSLSDGTLRFMCLATLLLQPTLPSTILIDEPELGLHPYAITLLANLLRSAAAKTQVVISTQSVPLVNQFAPEDIVVVDREQGQSVFKRLNQQAIANWLEDYGVGDLWEKNVIGGRP